ncbi:hypothetical protein Tco_1456202 [Tanacetum coccineum]
MPVRKRHGNQEDQERKDPSGHRFSKKKTTTVPEKTMTPRSCLRWKQTGKIFKTVGLRWVPTGKLFNSCTGKVDSEPTHGSIVDIPHIHACKQTLGLSAGLVLHQMVSAENNTSGPAPFLNVQMTSVHISSGLVLHQMVSAENNTSGPVPQCSNVDPLFSSVQASFFIIMTFEHNSSGLVPQCQFTSDHNSSELVIQDHNNEQSSSKLVPKAVP